MYFLGFADFNLYRIIVFHQWSGHAPVTPHLPLPTSSLYQSLLVYSLVTDRLWYAVTILYIPVSFFPSSVSLWNKLPDKAKSSVTLTEFKNHLSQVFPSNRPPTFFSIGPRYLSVLHTRLRLGQSLLKAHLFKIGLCDTPLCECGSGNENETHFLLLCER